MVNGSWFIVNCKELFVIRLVCGSLLNAGRRFVTLGAMRRFTLEEL